MGAKPGPKPKPLSKLKPTALWYRTRATPEQVNKHRETSDAAGSTPKKIKERSEDNKNRRKLGLKKGDHRNAARKKGGGFIAQADSINKAANGHGKRSRFSA